MTDATLAEAAPRTLRRTSDAPDKTSNAPVVEIAGVGVRFGNAPPALLDVDLSLRPREFLAIVGPSGCGKSTLLKLVSGLLKPTSGGVRVRGQAVTQTPAGVGFMFQRDTLLPWFTVTENIATGFDCRGLPRAEQKQATADLLEMLGLSAFANYYPRALSGGMRQRVALGRLLAYRPDIYLMDEPFGALDAQTKLLMGAELQRIWSADRKAVVFVTHDIDEAVALADRVIVMSGRPGRIKAEFDIDLPRPRDLLAIRRDSKFQELSQAIWQQVLG